MFASLVEWKFHFGRVASRDSGRHPHGTSAHWPPHRMNAVDVWTDWWFEWMTSDVIDFLRHLPPFSGKVKTQNKQKKTRKRNRVGCFRSGLVGYARKGRLSRQRRAKLLRTRLCADIEWQQWKKTRQRDKRQLLCAIIIIMFFLFLFLLCVCVEESLITTR